MSRPQRLGDFLVAVGDASAQNVGVVVGDVLLLGAGDCVVVLQDAHRLAQRDQILRFAQVARHVHLLAHLQANFHLLFYL